VRFDLASDDKNKNLRLIMTYNLDEKYLLMMPHKHIFESQPPSSMSIKQGKNEVILDNKKEEIKIQL